MNKLENKQIKKLRKIIDKLDKNSERVYINLEVLENYETFEKNGDMTVLDRFDRILVIIHTRLLFKHSDMLHKTAMRLLTPEQRMLVEEYRKRVREKNN